MIKYLAFQIGAELEGKYFSDSREAFNYIKSLSESLNLPLSDFAVEAVEIPE